MNICGRFAPSPTGRLHLGNARTALLAWGQVRARAGRFLLRIEDLDPDRSRPEHESRLLEDLSYLQLDWDGEPLRQSTRYASYQEALKLLDAEGRIYPCFCSRAEIARAASAPHGDEGPRYPGTCAELNRAQQAERARARKPSLRFRTPSGVVAFKDEVHGHFTQDVQGEVGDFIVQRADGVASYQLAVVVDDIAQGVNHVLRGDDLLPSTARQLLLYAALKKPPPTFAHVPLLLSEDGERLAKRSNGTAIEEYRERQTPAPQLVDWLAYTLGLADSAAQGLEHFRSPRPLAALRREPPADAWALLAALH